MGSLRGAIKERGSMITKDMLDNFRRSISVGETLKIENPFTANIVREDPEGKYSMVAVQMPTSQPFSPTNLSLLR